MPKCDYALGKETFGDQNWAIANWSENVFNVFFVAKIYLIKKSLSCSL